jgi:peptidyl-prolyl cis-trans isomerase SurA
MKSQSSALAAAGLVLALVWTGAALVSAAAAPGVPPPGVPPATAAPPVATPAAPRAAADTARAGEERVDGITAVVGGEPIFQSEVDEQLYLYLMQSGARLDSLAAIGMRKEILAKLVDEKLIVQEAKRKQVSVVDAELDAQVNQASRPSPASCARRASARASCASATAARSAARCSPTSCCAAS